MDEQEARAILARIYAADIPPPRISVEAARTSGRRKLRRRRAALSGTPAVAVAVVALLAGGILPGFHVHQPHQSTPQAAGSPPLPTRAFDPLVPYATLGWLPAGQNVLEGTTDRHFQFLEAGSGSALNWLLSVFSQDRCNLTAEQVLQRLHQGLKPSLKCAVAGPGVAQTLTVKAQAPSVHGRPAFTVGRGLVWEYTRGSWATLQGSARRPSPALMARIAAGVAFARPQPAPEYPYQLTGLPAAWQVNGVNFVADHGIMRGRTISVGVPGDAQQASVDVQLARPGTSCSFFPGQSQRRTINGFAVITTRTPGHGRDPVGYQVCAAHARGLFVSISTYGSQRPRAVRIFTRNLRILGSDPARWTTRPLS